MLLALLMTDFFLIYLHFPLILVQVYCRILTHSYTLQKLVFFTNFSIEFNNFFTLSITFTYLSCYCVQSPMQPSSSVIY